MGEMVTIREEDLIESIADALQYISYFHPMDYIRALAKAWEREENPAARDAMAQVLANSRMCAEGHRPICQDTGIVNVFLKWGQECRLESNRSLQDVVDEGVRRAYMHPENKLRASIVADPAFTRRNTRDNTPCVLNVEMVPGRTVSVDVAAKGGGSENKSKFKMMNPSDSVVDWVVEMIPQMGAGWCPPGQIGIGIGGTAEKAVLLAKESLMDEIDMHELKARGPQTDIEKLRVEIFDKVNALGIGAQGLGGLTTVLDVKIKEWPCHAAGKPVAMIPNCSATRHAHFTLNGSGPSFLETPKLDEWPKIDWAPDTQARRVNLDTLTPEEVQSWRAGDTSADFRTAFTRRRHRKISGGDRVHLNVQVNPVEQRARHPALVIRTTTRRATATQRWIAHMPAATRIHRRHQLNARREGHMGIGARNRNLSRFQRLAQGIQHCSLKFGQFIQKQDAQMGQAHLARTHA